MNIYNNCTHTIEKYALLTSRLTPYLSRAIGDEIPSGARRLTLARFIFPNDIIIFWIFTQLTNTPRHPNLLRTFRSRLHVGSHEASFASAQLKLANLSQSPSTKKRLTSISRPRQRRHVGGGTITWENSHRTGNEITTHVGRTSPSFSTSPPYWRCVNNQSDYLRAAPGKRRHEGKKRISTFIHYYNDDKRWRRRRLRQWSRQRTIAGRVSLSHRAVHGNQSIVRALAINMGNKAASTDVTFHHVPIGRR